VQQKHTTILVSDIQSKKKKEKKRNEKAKIVHYVLESGADRFFFGCDQSTEQDPCPGTPQWTHIQVPEHLKIEVLKEKGIFRAVNHSKKGRSEEGGI
jgi:hypothetical protein